MDVREGVPRRSHSPTRRRRHHANGPGAFRQSDIGPSLDQAHGRKAWSGLRRPQGRDLPRGIPGRAEILPPAAIDPDTHATTAARLIRNHDHDGFVAVIQTLAMAQSIVPANAQEIAQVLAHAARLVRSVVAAQCREGLDDVVSDVRADFSKTLFARAEAGGYDPKDADALFSAAFAQTLVFGLLLAREAGGNEVGPHAYEQLADATYPLLRGTLRALTLDEVCSMLGAAFDVTVNSVDPALLEPVNGRDPVLYEDFLRVFDPEAVKRYGVYYTPPDVVRLIVASRPLT